MALAIYRKYRPSLFKDVLGQELTVKILKEAAKQDRFSHAYLLSGPRGTGKTTVARLIAKIANCEKRLEGKGNNEPCGACAACKSIDDGTVLDIVEIDAASNRGIDEIRDLKESVRLAPSVLKYKVFIIDEAHMLTKDAFNALLKTLEEPPTYVIIILATTEFEKIPVTISSRTQKFHFHRPSMKQIAEKLQTIARSEKIKISKEALELIATSAEGSFRDAESLLDQMVNFGDKDIALKDVERMIGTIGFDTISGFCGFLLKKELESALKRLSEIYDDGYDITRFTKDLIQYLRRAAVLHYAPQSDMFQNELMAEHIQMLSAHAKIFEEKHLRLISSLIIAYSQMRYSQFPIIPLEVAIIENLKPKTEN